MRFFVSLSAALMLAALALTACNSSDGSGSGSTGRAAGPTSSAPAQTSTAPADGVERITTAELRDAMEKGTVVVVDVRSPDSYKVGHIRGSVNIPEPEIAKRKGELPPDKKIVLYCS
jgi:3-mercaptopyruvate sulfurtransferase SseA/predicted small secreted protein